MPKKKQSGGLVKAGDTGLLRSIAAVSATQEKLLSAAADIRLNPDEAEAAYMARQLVQCTLPHRDPGNVEVWTRTNGNLTLVVQRGYDDHKGKLIGYPWGSLPRLLLFWICTESCIKRSRRLQLGKSLSRFMLEIGLNPDMGTGKRSDARRLREQMLRLFAARISFQQSGPASRKWLNMDVTADGELWWDVQRPNQSTLWESWIELGEKFYSAITAAPVPADTRALRALKQSPLALDLYAWATYKAYSVSRRGQEQFIPWAGLMHQVGADYADLSDFRKKATATLRKIQTVYPGLKLRRAEDGIAILPTSRPAILPREENPVLSIKAGGMKRSLETGEETVERGG